MKTHAELGSNAIAQAEADADKPVEFLAIAKLIARSHHEKWDGSGYPGPDSPATSIPIAARLMALADVFDALTCKRVYKPAFSHLTTPTASSSMAKETTFDPDIVADAFVREYATFITIAKTYAE